MNNAVTGQSFLSLLVNCARRWKRRWRMLRCFWRFDEVKPLQVSDCALSSGLESKFAIYELAFYPSTVSSAVNELTVSELAFYKPLTVHENCLSLNRLVLYGLHNSLPNSSVDASNIGLIIVNGGQGI